MAIYKPSNFYPSMDEINMLENNIFECQVNTDGSKVKSYKVEIYSEDGILLYENFGEFDKPIGNNEYAQIEIKPYEFSGKQYLRINDKSYIKADFISSFFTLNPYAYDYCPYNVYEILQNDSKYFWIKGKGLNDEDFSKPYNIIDVSGGVLNSYTDEEINNEVIEALEENRLRMDINRIISAAQSQINHRDDNSKEIKNFIYNELEQSVYWEYLKEDIKGKIEDSIYRNIEVSSTERENNDVVETLYDVIISQSVLCEELYILISEGVKLNNFHTYNTLVFNINEAFNVNEYEPMILSVGLNNNFNYKWKVRFYEDSLKEMQKRKIFINYEENEFEIILNGSGEIIFQSLVSNWNIKKYYVNDFLNNIRQDYEENIHKIFDNYSNIYLLYHKSGGEKMGLLIYLIDKNNIKVEKYDLVNNVFDLKEVSITNIDDEFVNNTFISSGYTTGTNKSVIWYNNNNIKFNNLSIAEKELNTMELMDKYIKENNYIEIMANEDNSFVFEEYIKKHFSTTGECIFNNTEIILKKNILITTEEQELEIPYFDFSKIDEENRYIAFILDLNNNSIESFLNLDNNENGQGIEDYYIKPYLSVFKNDDKYIFIEKITQMYKNINNEWVIQIENKQLLNFLSDQNDIFINKMKNLGGNYGVIHDDSFISEDGNFKWDINKFNSDVIWMTEDFENGYGSELQNFAVRTLSPDIIKLNNNYYSYNLIVGNLCNSELFANKKLFVSNIQAKIEAESNFYWFIFPPSFTKTVNKDLEKIMPSFYYFYSGDILKSTQDETFINYGKFIANKNNNMWQKYTCAQIETYDNLAKGVNPVTGENISLTSQQYGKLMNLSNWLSTKFPELVVTTYRHYNGHEVKFLGIKNSDYESGFCIGNLKTLDYVYPAKNISTKLIKNFSTGIKQALNFNVNIKKTEKTDIYDIDYIIFGELDGKYECCIKNVYIENFLETDLIAFLGVASGKSLDYYLSEIKITLSPKEKSDLLIPFQFNFLQREKIYDHVKNLGNDKNINKITFEDDFSTYLKNLQSYNLYTCDNKSTNSSVYVSPNGEIQVGRYIRFPTIDGLVYNVDNFKSNADIAANEKIGAVGYYVKSDEFKVTESMDVQLGNTKNFFKENKNFILYKIIGYDPDTGEVRLENNVYRKLTNTDIYEIWERREESGETTEEYYSRKLPAADNLETFLKVGGECVASIACKNSNENEIFIQPNVNVKPDVFYSPQLKFNNGDTIDINFVYDMDEVYDYSLRDKTINKLDNSQWIITTNDKKHPIKCETPYSVYNAYVDSVPESYFYARDLANINLRYIAKENYVKNMDVKTCVLWNTDVEEGYTVVRTMNTTFIGDYSGKTPVKRFRYRLYTDDEIMILDSENVYSNDIIFEVNGLKNDCIYILSLEVEDQYGYIYNIKKSFKTSYTVNYVNYDFYTSNTDFGNGVMLYTDASIDAININGGTAKELQNNGISTIQVYKNREDYLFDYVTSFNIDYSNVVEKNVDINKNIREFSVALYYSLDNNLDDLLEDFLNFEINSLNEIIKFDMPTGWYVKSNEETQNNNVYHICNNNEKFYFDITITDKRISMDHVSTDILSWVMKKNSEKQITFSPYCIGNIDYNVGNDILYDYLFITKIDITDNAGTYDVVKVSHRTCFKQWSISNIIRQDNNQYKVKDIWNIKYNLETSDITNNTSVTKWDTLGRYSQVSIGERGYESSSVSCLLGDISEYTISRLNKSDIKKEGYNEYTNNKYRNNIKKLNNWKKFCRDGQLKLLQDYKGNKWIVQILENPIHTINIATAEQMSTISFNWSEVMDSTGLSIIGDITDK